MNRSPVVVAAICLIASASAQAGKPIQQRLFPAAEWAPMLIEKRTHQSDEEISCKRYRKPGSRLEKEHCRTRSAWADLRLRTRHDPQMLLLR